MYSRNKALWLDVQTHATSFNQSEYFISSLYATLWHWLQVAILSEVHQGKNPSFDGKDNEGEAI